MKTKFLGMAALALALLVSHVAEAAKANSYPALPGGWMPGDQIYTVRNGVDYTNDYAGENLGYATGTLGFLNGGTGLTALGNAGQCIQVNSAGTALQYGSCGTSGGSYTNGTGLSLTGGAFAVIYGTTSGTAAQGNDSRLALASTALQSVPAPSTSSLGGLLALASSTAHQVVAYVDTAGVQHLVQLAASDISGLGTAATANLSAFLQPANNLSDVASPSAARTNLGLGTAATAAASTFAQVANNLSDLASAATARVNLGLGSLATQNTVNLASQVTGTLPAANVATLNQNTTGNAATASALAATPSACASGQFATGISANGTPACSTPASGGTAGITGLIGDVTTPANSSGSTAATLAPVGTAGTYGSASSVNTITTDAKGRVTAIVTNPIAIGVAQVSGAAPTASPAFSGAVMNSGSETTTGLITANGGISTNGLTNSGTETTANLTLTGIGTAGGFASIGTTGAVALGTVLPTANGGFGVAVLNPAAAAIGLAVNPITGASAEYPMYEGTGTVVHDVSGNNRTASFSTGSLPTWTGYGVSFNAGTSSLNQYITTPVTTFKTVLLNVCPTTYLQNSQNIITVNANEMFLSANASGISLINSPALNVPGTMAFTPSVYNGYNTYPTSTSNETFGCSTIAYTFDTLDHVYINGAEVSYTTQGTDASLITTTGSYLLGGTGSTQYAQEFIGTINYAVFYPTVLTPAQVLLETNYINAQVQNRTGFPNTPVYANTIGNQWICVGDSLTSAKGGTGSVWCNNTYMPTNTNYNKVVWAYGGDSTFNITTTSNSRYLTSISPYGGKNVCSHWHGTNDAGVSAQTVWNGLVYDAQIDKARGCVPVVTTMISRTGEDTFKDSLNALIRNYWRQAGFAALNDLGAIPAIGADGANTNTACFNSDKTHLLGPGAGSCFDSLSGYGVVGAQTGNLANMMDGATSSTPTLTTSNAYVETYADNYVVQTPTAAATHQLVDCTGFTGITRSVFNGSSTYPITATTTNSQTITGSATISPNGNAVFTCELTSATTGGNYWLRTQ